MAYKRANNLTGLALALAAATALTATAPALASVHPPAEISSAAEAFARERLVMAPGAAGVEYEIKGAAVDPRLRLARCGQPLTPFLPSGSQVRGNVSVGVRCADTPGWTVYVPVTVEIWADVLVMIRSLPRGAEVGEDDVTHQRHEVSRLARGWIGDLGQLHDRRLARAIAAGAMLTPTALEAAPVVRRGETVTLRAAGGGIQIRASGVALGDAALGERVSVRNQTSQRVVEGRVAGPGIVEFSERLR